MFLNKMVFSISLHCVFSKFLMSSSVLGGPLCQGSPVTGGPCDMGPMWQGSFVTGVPCNNCLLGQGFHVTGVPGDKGSFVTIVFWDKGPL